MGNQEENWRQAGLAVKEKDGVSVNKGRKTPGPNTSDVWKLHLVPELRGILGGGPLEKKAPKITPRACFQKLLS